MTDDTTVSLDGDLETGTVTITHGAEESARAAVMTEDGTVLAVVLIAPNWEQQDPAQRYQPTDGELLVLEDHEHPATGWRWDGSHWHEPLAPPAPAPEPLTGEAALRRDVDLLLQLVLTSQDGEANDVASLAPTLRGMAERTSLTTAAVDGAFGWGVITSDERAELLEVAHPPREPVQDDLDGDDPEEDDAT